jgi:hypothetical protein
MAEGEEVSSQDESTYGSNIPIFLRGIIDNTTDIDSGDAGSLSDIDYIHMNNLHIPETVWSMGARTVDRLSRMSAEQDLITYAESGAHLESADFWSGTALGSWDGSATDHASNLLIPSALFQVASCGGDSAEHSDLNFCNIAEMNLNHLDNNPNSSTHINKNPNAQSPSGGPTTANKEADTLSTVANIPSNPTPTPLSNVPASGDLTLAGQCGSVAAYCVPFRIELQATPPDPYAPDPSISPIGYQTPTIDQTPPIGDQTPPVGDQTPPTDQTPPIGDQTPPIGDPTPPGTLSSGSGGSPSEGGTRPIPEAPTWVMTAIGFSVVAFIFRRKRHTLINSISIIDNN